MWEQRQLWNVPPTLAELHPARARRRYCISEEGKTKDQCLVDEHRWARDPNANEKRSQDQIVPRFLSLSSSLQCFILNSGIILVFLSSFPACVIALVVLMCSTDSTSRCLPPPPVYKLRFPSRQCWLLWPLNANSPVFSRTCLTLNPVFDPCAWQWFGTSAWLSACLVYRFGLNKQTLNLPEVWPWAWNVQHEPLYLLTLPHDKTHANYILLNSNCVPTSPAHFHLV